MSYRLQCPPDVSTVSVQGQVFQVDSEGTITVPRLEFADELIRTGLGYKMGRGMIIVSDDVAEAIKSAGQPQGPVSPILQPNGTPFASITSQDPLAVDPAAQAIEAVANMISTAEKRSMDASLTPEQREAAMAELMTLGERFVQAQKQARASTELQGTQAAGESSGSATSPESPSASPAGAGTEDNTVQTAGSGTVGLPPRPSRQ
jgi:hypothetical protein